MNEFIAATKATYDLVTESSNGASVSAAEHIRLVTQSQLDTVRAAHRLAQLPADADADKIAGTVLLERIRRAIAVRSINEWEAAAAAAIEAAGADSRELAGEIKDWLDAVGPIDQLGMEALSRAQEQAHQTMIEGFRRGAAQTPGMDLRIEEVVNGVLVHEEVILGPERGHEDGPGRGTGHLSATKQDALGVDDDRFDVTIARLNDIQARLILERYALPSTSEREDVRRAVVGRMLQEIERDLTVAIDLTGELPMPIRRLTPQHFPALRAQFLQQYNIPLNQGAVHSRAMRGDASAQGMLSQFIIIADMLQHAEPYYLPADQIPADPSGTENDLPADSTFLVWHDGALPIGGDVHVLAWLFATDEQGDLCDAAQVIMLNDGNELEGGWCNLRSGMGAAAGRRVVDALRAGQWQQAKPLHLPGELDSKPWKKALIRSATRVKAGALHGLHTLG